ncbi:MAG: isoamylase [Gracilimonas sp.]|uniref:glycogen debranching protein n=1 Tax=Gracilimonas sp. TaxID=1974203 RepID=UPI0037508FAF|nr:isoamylase [Gracilimonas sp.]
MAEKNINKWEQREGTPYPLGVTSIDGDHACNFALYSETATGVTLLLYAKDDTKTPCYKYSFDLAINKTAHIWHCRVPHTIMQKAACYAYRIEGPDEPASGKRFDPDKILLDPYAEAVYFPPDFDRKAAQKKGSNAGKAPLGVIHTHAPAFDWEETVKPKHTHDTIIYELHVHGFTRHTSSGISPAKRGTFRGVVEKIPYLKELGVTVVELMPVHQNDPQEKDYWGYMPLNFFSPNRSYGSCRQPDALMNEFRAMVKALHEADMEVIMDVVYNHTAEGDENGPTYSYRGIDNETYYLLEDDRRHYRNDAGTGNVLNCADPAVRKMIMDSLRFWVTEMQVDGFRFDLASIFTRNRDGSLNLDDPPLISEISGDPAFTKVRLIAEAWDVSSYQLGVRFPGITWMQWNGKYRDDMRRFVKGDSGMVGSVMTRMYGSDDLFPDSPEYACHAWQSVNFINAHDGFSLYDLVSYNYKHNEANGHDNRDGMDHNFSWNCGWEGDEHVPGEVMELRRRQAKNFCSLLFLSNGTPMFRAGDEFLNTQYGNNNPYNQNNEINWLDWTLKEENEETFRFFKRMIAFRKQHPSLGRSRFWRSDVHWYGTDGPADTLPDSHSIAFYLDGASEEDDDLYVMINAWWNDLDFTIQEGTADDWKRVVDTSLPSPNDIAEPGGEKPIGGITYTVKARSVVVLIRKRTIE